ncbi:MAG: amidohydrolase family protein [Gammaproteobacteria bacterium]
MTTASARIRAGLNHPLIDGDSHIIEYTPVLLDYVKEAGGADAVADFDRQTRGGRSAGWYQMSWEERRYHRNMRAPWWALPAKNTYDRCTAMLPKLYHERMDDFGLDFAVLYPTVGLGFPALPDDEFRPIVCHAYNEYIAECYGPYTDRMTPAAVVPMHTPEEGIRELEHAKALGLKVVMIPSFVRRPVPRIAAESPEVAKQITWLDNYSIDSEHDYDPFWAKCEELGFAVAAHSGGMGFDDRKSMSNYMYNHMGHFAAAGEVLCKGLLMGGVTKRFPKLRVALLEGGVVNGARLYVDIHARWKKRNLDAVENMNPANIDTAKARELFEQYADDATLEKIDRLEDTLGVGR